MEARRKGLEEAQQVGKQELDAAREELKLAADGLEGDKEELKAAWKVDCFVVVVRRWYQLRSCVWELCSAERRWLSFAALFQFLFSLV